MASNLFNDINPIEFGRRIASARKVRNLSQDDVAKHIGVSRPLIIAIEKGSRFPKPQEIISLAALFNMPVHDLVSNRPIIESFALQGRFTSVEELSEEAATAARIEFKNACEDYLELQSLSDRIERLRYPEPYSLEGWEVQSAAEEIATLERDRLILGQGPISNLLNVLEADVGLLVFVLPIQEFKIAGMFAYTDKLGGCVLINGNHPVTRQNWTAAHECGHFVSDRYSTEITILLDYKRKPRKEQFADLFASAFLMPASGLRQRFRRIEQAKKDFTIADLFQLAEQYGVSVEAMTYRLEKIGCLDRGTWAKVSLSQRNQKKSVAHDIRPNRKLHLPEKYVMMAVKAFEQELITEGRLARYLHCTRVEAREIVDRMTYTEEVDEASGRLYELDLMSDAPLSRVSGERERA